MKEGDKVVCVKSYDDLTVGKVYDVVSVGYYNGKKEYSLKGDPMIDTHIYPASWFVSLSEYRVGIIESIS